MDTLSRLQNERSTGDYRLQNVKRRDTERVLNKKERRADKITFNRRLRKRSYQEKRNVTIKFILKMKITSQQWIDIIKLISTFIIGVISTLCVQSCTMSMSIFKNNNGGNQQTEQSTKVDSTQIYVKPIK